MNGYDVEAHVEFAIKRLHDEIAEGLPYEEQVHIYERLCDLYELRIEQLEQSQKDLRDIRDYYQNRIGSKD